mgnify:CR=1 FL=1
MSQKKCRLEEKKFFHFELKKTNHMKSNFQELIKLNICKTSQVRDPDPAIWVNWAISIFLLGLILYTRNGGKLKGQNLSY